MKYINCLFLKGSDPSRRIAAAIAISLLLAQHAATQARFGDVEAVAAEGHRQTGAPGLSVAVVIDDQLAWSKGFGLADVENEVPARANTVYRIASISKPIAATAVMQLVERGRVALDDPIQKYVPAFPSKGEHTITVRHLLTHTSGIRHYRSSREMESRDRYETVEEAFEIFRNDPLLFVPGSKYSYSTYGYNLLAGVVESASGLTFEPYLRQHVLDPAGMKETYLDHADAIIPHRARQYVREGRILNAPFADLSNKWAGGGMLSTAEDLARFHIALDQGKLLKPETLRQMYTPARLTDGTATTYGLGWAVSKDDRGRAWIAHAGGATGGTTYLLRDPQRKLAVALLCNVQNADGLGALAIRVADEAARPLPVSR